MKYHLRPTRPRPRFAAAAWRAGIALGWLVAACAAEADEPCSPAFARVVSVEGQADVKRPGGSWQTLARDATLCAGDMLRVQPRSRAALRLANETTLRLDQGTSLTLLAPNDAKATLVDQTSGGLNVITRTPQPFRIRTPFVNANVEGTEFMVRVGAQDASVAVFEGQVRADNDAGAVVLASGEAAQAVEGAAPAKTLPVRPADAVTWAMYFPAVYRRPAGPVAPDTPAFFVDRAAAALQVGRADEAAPDLQQALRLDPQSGDALALQAVMRVLVDDKPGALALAQRAIAAAPRSVTAWMALSHARQAQFDIPGALAAAQEARSLDPANAPVWARVAELELASGRQREATRAAEQAVAIDPAVARTQTVLGFVHLARIDAAAARAAFEKAIALDAADPLPHLGLGLAIIRTGQIAAGREELEVAASLDPAQSLLRSYLGKAYYEEKRDRLAASQFELAKRADPNDPTPYLYDAIRKQADNRPRDAWDDFNTSIALNDNRAVYRSRLLLDQDRATRQVELAAVISELSSEREATVLASDSVTADPSNDAAHRFLSDAYGRRDRHEIARTSELLQAQLLRPLSLQPIAPELPFTDLSLPTAPLQGSLFTSESSSMFEYDRQQASVELLGGSRGTAGLRTTASILSGRLAASVGAFRYSTDGFRPNSDIAHEIYNAFVQYAVSPELSLQAELRQRRSDFGDIAMNFDPTMFAPHDRADIAQDGMRLGLTYRPGPDKTVLSLYARNRSHYDYRFFDGDDLGLRANLDDKADQYELQYQQTFGLSNVVVGGGYSTVESTNLFDIPSCPPCGFSLPSDPRQRNAYLYANLRPSQRWALTLGVSRDLFDDSTTRLHQWNPKIGTRLELSDRVTLRLAHFGTLKRALITQQTIEPTQVAGFNQFLDDPVSTVSKTTAAALDLRWSPVVSGGVELGHQDLTLHGGNVGANPAPAQVMDDRWLRFDATWKAWRHASLSAGLSAEYFTYDSVVNSPAPAVMRTVKMPLALRAFPQGRFFGEVVVTPVHQRVERAATSQWASGADRFAVTDLSVGYRLPSRLGTLSLDAKNLFNKKFSYQGDNFRNTDVRLSPFLPVRRVSLKASLVF